MLLVRFAGRGKRLQKRVRRIRRQRLTNVTEALFAAKIHGCVSAHAPQQNRGKLVSMLPFQLPPRQLRGNKQMKRVRRGVHVDDLPQERNR